MFHHALLRLIKILTSMQFDPRIGLKFCFFSFLLSFCARPYFCTTHSTLLCLLFIRMPL
jgi:hypothetical protein